MGDLVTVKELMDRGVTYSSVRRAEAQGFLSIGRNKNGLFVIDFDKALDWATNYDPVKAVLCNSIEALSDKGIIRTSSGDEILCDLEDLDALSKITWSVQRVHRKNGQIRKYATGRDAEGKQVSIHRLLMGFPQGLTVDHINGTGLDNRRSNLRLATKQENCRNRSKPSNNTSGYKGVTWIKSTNRWRAIIKVEGKAKYLGDFLDKEEAARAYNEAAKVYFKEFAYLNDL